jgi:hypothetical protein
MHIPDPALADQPVAKRAVEQGEVRGNFYVSQKPGNHGELRARFFWRDEKQNVSLSGHVRNLYAQTVARNRAEQSGG